MSEHFQLSEFTYSRAAIEHGVNNDPTPEAKEAIRHLVKHLLEPLRQCYQKPIAILSGYRSKEVNRLVGGVANSQHCKGEAADCYVADGADKLLETLQASGLPFDQAILYKKRNFLHLSLKREGINRMQVLFYLLCVVGLLTGCGTKKNRQVYREFQRSDSIRVERTDSLQSYARLWERDSLQLKVMRIEYLPPDNTGIQPLKQVTVAHLQTVADKREHVVAVVDSQQTSEVKQAEQQEIKTAEQREPVNYRRWLLLIGAVVVLMVLKQKRPSSQTANLHC